MNRENNIGKIEHRRSNKSKRIRNNLCLLIGIIVLILIVGTSFAVIKTTKTGANVLDNLSGDTTEDVWQITSVSDEEETEENTEDDDETIYDDSEVSAISEETEVANIDDGVSAIADSSDYTITVTEYTGDTITAEYDTCSSHLVIYIVDDSSLEQLGSHVYDIGTIIYADDIYETYSDLYTGYTLEDSPIFLAYDYTFETSNYYSLSGSQDLSYVGVFERENSYISYRNRHQWVYIRLHVFRFGRDIRTWGIPSEPTGPSASLY